MKDIYRPVHELLREKLYDEALDLLMPNSSSGISRPYDNDLNHAWYLVGDILFKLGKFDEAISAFKKSLLEWPEDRDAILALANSYSENGMPGKAEKTLREGLKIDPSNEKFQYNLANALFDQRKYSEAITVYNLIKNDEELIKLAVENIKRAKKGK